MSRLLSADATSLEADGDGLWQFWFGEVLQGEKEGGWQHETKPEKAP